MDRRFLADHAGFREGPIAERSFWLNLDGERCFALLRWSAEHRPPAILICHSDAWEFSSLRRLEADLARAAALLGHPVLSLHRRGFGDSSGSLAEATLERQVGDVQGAMGWIRAETGIESIGLAAARFGALVAGAVARAGGVDDLVLVNPTLRGGRYLGEVLRQAQAVELATRSVPNGSPRGAARRLHETGMLDAIGYPIHWPLVHGLQEVDLTADIGRFAGRALAVQVSRAPTVRKDLDAFRRRVEAAGGACRIELIPEPAGSLFGESPYVASDRPGRRIDAQRPIRVQLSDMVTRWLRP